MQAQPLTVASKTFSPLVSVPMPKQKFLPGGVATRIPIVAPTEPMALMPGLATSGAGLAFSASQQQRSPALSKLAHTALLDMDNMNIKVEGPVRQEGGSLYPIDVDTTAEPFDLVPSLTAPTTTVAPNQSIHAEMVKEPYVMIRNRYNTEGKRKWKCEGGSSEESADEEEEEEEVDGDDESDEGARAGRSRAGRGSTRGRKPKSRSKIASALIWHMPPEKKTSKKKAAKDEPDGGNPPADKETVRGEPVVVRLYNPPTSFAMRVSVVTNEKPRPRPHAFQLTGHKCKNGIYMDIIKAPPRAPPRDHFVDINFSKVGMTYTKWKNMDKFLELRNSTNVNPFQAEGKLTILEMKASGKANKPAATVAKPEPVEPSRPRKRGRKPKGSKARKSDNPRQAASQASPSAAPATCPNGAPPVNHVKQFRLAFEFFRVTSGVVSLEERLCAPLLSQPVFTDFEYLKIENVNPTTAVDTVPSNIWIATSKLDYTNRPTTVRFISDHFHDGFAFGSVVECHKQVLLIVQTPKFDTPLESNETAQVTMELVRFSEEREEVSNQVEITFRRAGPDGPESKVSRNDVLQAIAVAVDGLQESVRSSTTLIGAGAPVSALQLQPQPQSVVVQQVQQPAPQHVRLMQVANHPGVQALVDQAGNIIQLLHNAQLVSVQQPTAQPTAIAIAGPGGQWTTAIADASAVSAQSARTQLIAFPQAFAGQQELVNPYSMAVTAPQHATVFLGQQQQQQQQQQQFEADFSSSLTALDTSSINSHLTQIPAQTPVSGPEQSMLLQMPASVGEEQMAAASSAVTLVTPITPIAMGSQPFLLQMQPALSSTPIYQ